ncbi:MAG: hypothetical protein WBE15_14605 [Candidatus Cybelea sp.]
MLFDHLPEDERDALRALRDGAGFYGIVRPRGGSEYLGTKAVDRDTALLFLTLAEASPLPSYVREAFDQGTGRSIARLVAENILEVDLGDGFVSGATALAAPAPELRPGESGRIAELSRAALRYAESLATDNPQELAWRLYAFNRLPVNPRWSALLAEPGDYARYIGIDCKAASSMLSRNWQRLPASTAWQQWTARTPAAATARLTHKLYISPMPEALARDGFAAIVSALSGSGVTHFKVGSGAAGLLRPDKIVAYFPDFESLTGCARRLQAQLSGMAAHGAPFTAEIDAEGLLSWGMDPPSTSSEGNGIARSWRQWLTGHIARAILAGRAVQSPQPAEYAMARVRLEGIDATTWTPVPAIFEGA